MTGVRGAPPFASQLEMLRPPELCRALESPLPGHRQSIPANVGKRTKENGGGCLAWH